MSIDAPFKPPRKKPSIFWWLGGTVLLLVLIFLLQLFGPSPRIMVSPQTTYIIEPLRANGLPDYEKYVLELHRKGVTPENNAAALLWQALWPGELDPPQYAAVAAELGLDEIPSEEDSLVPISGKATSAHISDWLRAQNATAAATDSGDPLIDSFGIWLDNSAEQVSDQAMSRPWTSEQIPPLAKWVTENRQPLNLILEASRRPRCYFPSPTLLNDQDDALVSMLLPGQQSVREAGRSLSGRAMWHLGEGRVDNAWQDILAIHRIAQLTTQGTTLVEQLISIALSYMACDRTVTLLHHGKLTVQQAKQIQRDLAAQSNFSQMADAFEFNERLMYLDAITNHRMVMFSDGEVGRSMGEFNWIDHLAIDWNVACRKGNEFYDRMAAAARLPTHAAREDQFATIDAELSRMARSFEGPTVFASAISPSARSEAAASIAISLFLPALDAACTAQHRANAALDLTRLAAALAVYRAEHGAYPQNLDELVPGVLDKLPVDLCNAKPYMYKRSVDGYLLYTTGENGQDDRGSNETMRKFEGREIEESDTPDAPQPQIPSGADDFSIRVPCPAFQLPKPQPTE